MLIFQIINWKWRQLIRTGPLFLSTETLQAMKNYNLKRIIQMWLEKYRLLASMLIKKDLKTCIIDQQIFNKFKPLRVRFLIIIKLRQIKVSKNLYQITWHLFRGKCQTRVTKIQLSKLIQFHLDLKNLTALVKLYQTISKEKTI